MTISLNDLKPEKANDCMDERPMTFKGRMALRPNEYRAERLNDLKLKG